MRVLFTTLGGNEVCRLEAMDINPQIERWECGDATVFSGTVLLEIKKGYFLEGTLPIGGPVYVSIEGSRGGTSWREPVLLDDILHLSYEAGSGVADFTLQFVVDRDKPTSAALL